MRPDGKRQSFPLAFKNAGAGVAHGLLHERNVQFDICFAAFALVLGFALGIEVFEWFALIICIGMVVALELVNTAIEAIVDLASPDFNEHARIAKDCAAGACLIASCAALIVGVIIFAPKLLHVLGLM